MMGDNDFATGYAIGQSDNGNRGNGMFGGDCWIWIIVVFALLFGWGNGGWGLRRFRPIRWAAMAALLAQLPLQPVR